MYTVYNLIERNVSGNEITVVAQYLPGDESIDYTSPYAGGNFSCITDDLPDTLKFDKYTYTRLASVQQKLGGPQCGLDRFQSTEFFDTKPSVAKINSLKSYIDNYTELPELELPKGCQYGIRYNSWSFNCPKYLANMKKYLEGQGVTFVQKKLSHISQAFFFDTKTVFNCTGNGAKHLGGVADNKVYPTRGQVVVVKAPHIEENVMRWGDDYATYIIKRPYSHDQLILGGFLQKDDWRAATSQEETNDILKRTTQLLPLILSKNPHGPRIEDLEILRVAAGLRPSRHGGTRIEKEAVDHSKSVVHNYGASGYGYQAGLGMGYRAVSLALDSKPKL